MSDSTQTPGPQPDQQPDPTGSAPPVGQSQQAPGPPQSNQYGAAPAPTSRREAKAQAKAQKAYRKANRPWYKKKRFILPAALVVLIVIIVISTSGGGGGSNTTTTNNNSNQNNGGQSQTGGGNNAAPNASKYDDAYGTFKTVSKHGQGDAIIPLPDSGKAGIVTLTHQGSANFSVAALDSSNQSTGELLVNTIGNYKGTTAYGLASIGNAAAKLKLTADGSWTAKIQPISAAKQMPGPAAGKGDAVYLYDGGAADWAIQHTGKANFVVTQYTSDLPNLMVNEIGNYHGAVPAVAGPSVVTIVADGTWSIKAK